MHAIRERIRKIAKWLIQQPVIKKRLPGMRICIWSTRKITFILWIMFARTGEVFMLFPYTLCISKFTCATRAHLILALVLRIIKDLLGNIMRGKLNKKVNRIHIKYVHWRGIKYVRFYDFSYIFVFLVVRLRYCNDGGIWAIFE